LPIAAGPCSGSADSGDVAATVGATGGWLAYAYGYLALMAGDLGEFERAHEYLADALGRVRTAGLSALEGSVVTQLAIVNAYQGSFAGCLESALQMRVIADRSALPYVLGMSRTAEGYARFHLTDGASGLEALRQAATFLGSRGLSLTLSWNHALLAECLALAGEATEAEFHARAALRRVKVQDRMGELVALRTLGLAAAVRRPEHPEEASGLLERARARAREKKNHREEALTSFRLGEVWMRAGERARATACLEAVSPTFESMNMPWYVERARRVLAR
jgi:tetratricopeptide (TPR) repeat protein